QGHRRAARARARPLRARRPEDRDPSHFRQGRVGGRRVRLARQAQERQPLRQPLRLDLRDPRRPGLRAARIHGLRLYPQATEHQMSNAYDFLTVGAGHNGLVAAAYLAAAGKKVLVLERNEWYGGGVVTRALTKPGFLHDQHSMAHIFIQGNPLLKSDELGLKSRHGLQYTFPDPPMMSVFE